MLCFVTGTGTGIGKTHLTQSLLGAAPAPAHGYKPIESGFPAECQDTDAAALTRASTFHVKQPGRRWLFAAPVSPHLAAERAGVSLDIDAVAAAIDDMDREAPITVVELPGVLHDVIATSTAASARGLVLDAVLLSAPVQPDESTADNARALRDRLGCPVFEAPRADIPALAHHDSVRGCASRLFRVHP